MVFVLISLGQNKIYVCLSSPDRPLFLTPDPKSFYGIWKTQEGNVVSKRVYKEFGQCLHKNKCILTPNSSNSRQKRL